MGAPKWVVTFTDLMSLLLTFFVLLLTFSTPRVEKLFELRGSIQYAFGIFPGKVLDDRDTWLPPNPTRQGRDQSNPYAPMLMPRFRPLEDREPNRDLMQLRDQSGEEIQWDRLESGYRIRLAEAINYRPAEVHMSADSFPRLAKIAAAVEHVPYSLVVVAVIGNDELPEIRLRRLDPMTLAADRAQAVVLRLVERHNLNPAMVGIAARFDHRRDSGAGTVEFVLALNERFLGGN